MNVKCWKGKKPEEIFTNFLKFLFRASYFFFENFKLVLFYDGFLRYKKLF